MNILLAIRETGRNQLEINLRLLSLGRYYKYQLRHNDPACYAERQRSLLEGQPPD